MLWQLSQGPAVQWSTGTLAPVPVKIHVLGQPPAPAEIYLKLAKGQLHCFYKISLFYEFHFVFFLLFSNLSQIIQNKNLSSAAEFQ